MHEIAAELAKARFNGDTGTLEGRSHDVAAEAAPALKQFFAW